MDLTRRTTALRKRFSERRDSREGGRRRRESLCEFEKTGREGREGEERRVSESERKGEDGRESEK